MNSIEFVPINGQCHHYTKLFGFYLYLSYMLYSLLHNNTRQMVWTHIYHAVYLVYYMPFL